MHCDDRSGVPSAVLQRSKPRAPSVLIIDDHAFTVKTYSTVLRLAGFRTVTAVTGRRGIELAASTDIDVGLVDLNLPDMRGVDVVRELRRLRCRAKLVIITAFPTLESSFEASASGADGYVDGLLFGDDVVDLVERARKGEWPLWRSRPPEGAGSASAVTPRMDPRIREALRHIDANLPRPWSNAELAAVVGLSESRFRYLFEMSTGVPMAAYIREHRLQEVALRLTDSTDDVRQIADHFGFTSLSLGDFRRTFRRRFGLSPTAYRRRHWRGPLSPK
jgi:AraC-like DNA-binding protein/CheY-like chemotaxis protein